MKRVYPAADWPESWRASYGYDLEEIYGEVTCRGYASAYQNRRQQAVRLLTDVLEPGTRILDVAAAQGNFTLALAEMGYDVTWNDLRAELADYVQLKHERGMVHFAPGDVFQLEFPVLFDGVLVTEIVEHVAHPDDFLAKTAQLVKPGGYVVMTTPNGAYFQNPLPKFSECANPGAFEAVQFKPNADGHIFLLHPDELNALAARAGLVIEEVVLFTNPLTSGYLKRETLLRVLPRSFVQGIEWMSQHLPVPLRRRVLIQMAARFRKPA